MAPLVSVVGYLALLQEPEPELQAHALRNLNQLVDQFWMEIADAGANMYCFRQGNVDCVVKSCMKTRNSRNESWLHWCSQRYHDLMCRSSLGLLPSWRVSRSSIICARSGKIIRSLCEDRVCRDYHMYHGCCHLILTLAQCVDRYIEQQIYSHDRLYSSETDGDEPMAEHDERLEVVVDRMFQRCIEDKEYTQALGVAIEARRPDAIVEILEKSKDRSLLDYVLQNAMVNVLHIQWRNDVPCPGRRD
jgi:26S proteasome regulatory subunit N2